MPSALMIYGATGYVGEYVARTAGRLGVKAIVAGRDAAKLDRIASETGLERRAFGLDDPAVIDSALNKVAVVLNCAGPFKYTAEPLVEACLRSGAHYFDLAGEIPVYEALQARDEQAKARGVMLLPGVGFDVVPTDCLALHLKQRLPSATQLRLGFQSVGPAGLPPGTQRTAIDCSTTATASAATASWCVRKPEGGRSWSTSAPARSTRLGFPGATSSPPTTAPAFRTSRTMSPRPRPCGVGWRSAAPSRLCRNSRRSVISCSWQCAPVRAQSFGRGPQRTSGAKSPTKRGIAP